MKRILGPLLALLGAMLLLPACKKNAAGGPSGGGRPPVQVVAMEARRQSVAENLSRVGSIVANEMVEIKSEIDGTVQKINFKEGEPVKEGELLIQLDESKLAAAVDEAEAAYKLSQTTFERSKQLFKENLVSPQEYDQAAATYHANEASLALKKRQLKDTRIYASFDGVTGARNVSPGQVISKNTTLTWLIDLDPVKVEFNVPEKFLSQIKVGQTIELTVSAYAGQTFKGDVFFVAPFVDPNTRTALVKARVANREGKLKPGMFANLDLNLKIREDTVVIPEAALSQIMDDNKAMVFVVDDQNTAQMRSVTVGVRLAGRVEILKGLQEGEKVVVEGAQKLGPGAKVKLAPPEASRPYTEEEKPSEAAKTALEQ